MERDAALSECGKYRYRLGRKWGPGPYLLFVMLNPSTADAEDDDPTIRRCVGFAKAHGYGALHVVNLYAYRATDPRDLKAAGYPVGPDNDDHIKAAVSGADAVCVAWGDRARGLSRPDEVLAMIARIGRAVGCLAITKHGLPSHPLMLAASCRMTDYPKRTGPPGPPPPVGNRHNRRFLMNMNEADIEALIQAKGLARPRLTPQDVDDTITAETFTTLPSGKVMVCELTLRNGFTVRGEAAVVSKANFNEEVGRTISRQHARSKVWELEGYLLQQRLYEEIVEDMAANTA